VKADRELSKMVKDPVCGMMVDPETAPAKAEHKGKTYYFCAPGCKVAFERDLEKCLESEASGEDRHHHGH
jgi:Cu+-exporting ATPase